MTTITGVPAFGGGGFAFRPSPDPPRPAVPPIAETATDGAATFTNGNGFAGQTGAAFTRHHGAGGHGGSGDPSGDPQAGKRDARTGSMAPARDPLPDDVIAGPTPAFQASVLEVERDLRMAIARLEAKRAREADEAAIAPVPRPQPHGAPEHVPAAPPPDDTAGTDRAQTDREALPQARPRDIQETTPDNHAALADPPDERAAD
ncbi:hypothetical protein [Celeribacter indicus]|uniref:Uncharacterized protein n=1 Tax=Celeribacter indicus TaxID=1208324 RepID=A0A0B5DWH0_9RHOB|nr:hypothetical protein [Celeribacter indicus]AJE47743.1 hypothetical protein P73_3028 [Celeribacter indicus]SDW21562.1 hypothetical protein SAMN05443573_10212 [Celeribacter indicus]